MRLAYAFLATAAEFAPPPSGRLSVIGGDFDTIVASAFPATHAYMTVVIKIQAQPMECGRAHNLRVEFINPDGVQLIPSLQTPFVPMVVQEYPLRPVGVGIALNCLGLTFERPGDYSIHILVDDIELGDLPLHLVPVPANLQGGNP